MSPHETQQVEEEPLEELWNLDVHEVTVVAAATTASTASCASCGGCNTSVDGPQGCLTPPARISSARRSGA
jgi:hypothetical protein